MFWSLCRVDARSGRALCLFVLAALLSLSVCASATEPNKLFLNKNPQALPIGLTFHPDVPNHIRKAIIEDLGWLSTRGPIKDERLRYLLQIDEPMTGASLVAWFLDRVHVVGTFGWCATADYVDIALNESGPLVTKWNAKCGNEPSAAEVKASVPATVFSTVPSEVVRGIALDRRVRIVPENWPAKFLWPVMKVSPEFLREGNAAPARVSRLGTLLHEASHVGGIPHERCLQSDWQLKELMIGPWKYPSPFFSLGKPFCDNPVFGSAFTIQGSFLRAMADYCHCSPKERLTIRSQEWATWRYHGVPFKEPIVVHSSRELRSTRGWVGTKLSNFPPAEFFEAGIKYTEAFLQLCQNRCRELERVKGWRAELIELQKFGHSLRDVRSFSGSWESSRPERPPLKRPLDIAGAKQWLAAAAKAAKDGYNVETISLVSCADLQDHC